MNDLFARARNIASDARAELGAMPHRPRGRHAPAAAAPAGPVKPSPDGSAAPPKRRKVHLYDLMGYAPRAQFEAYHARTERHACLVCHRRAGKTVAAVAELVREALAETLPNPQCAYIAPFYRQAKAVAWQYLQDMTRHLPGYKPNQSELSVSFTAQNGRAKVMLFGADNPDSLRGLYFDAVVMDEPAQMSPRLWPEIVRPALSDRHGRATFIGTPAGRNAFYVVYRRAVSSDDWFSLELKASESGIVPEEELASVKADMSESQYDQEFEVDFGAAVMGAYFGREMSTAWAEGRITRVAPDFALPLHVVMDLGYSDLNATWLFQAAGTEIRLIMQLDYQFMALPEIIGDIRKRAEHGWSQALQLGRWLGPHDINVHELGTGKSRWQTAADLGVHFDVVPKLTVDDGIERLRVLFPRLWFDEELCADGVVHMEQYRADFDEKRNRLKALPRHDEHSHAADALRLLACSSFTMGSNLMTNRTRSKRTVVDRDRGII